MTNTAQNSVSALANRFTRAVAFVNVQSGCGKSRELLPMIEREFLGRGIPVEIIETAGGEDLAIQAQQQIRAGTRLLFSVGGDGTCQRLVNIAYGHDVVLGLIPAGGGNDFARALGLPNNPIAALQATLAGEPRAVDLVKVCTADGRGRFYLGGGGIGLDAAAAHHASSRYRNWPGRTRYVASAIRAYASCLPIRIRITPEPFEGESVWQSVLLASVLNTPTFGAGIHIAPTAKIDDGLLNLVLLDDLRIGRLLRLLPQLALRGTLNLPALRTMIVRKVQIETDPPTIFHGDGELLGLTPVEIEVVPRAIQFLAPKQSQR
jgi:diacylglycerol kinase (ATP)